MPNAPDKSSTPDWNEFVPLPRDAVAQKPEAAGPYIRQRGGCQFCSSRRFLRSAFRSADIGHLFLLRYPVRCARCRQRQFTDFLTASLAPAPGSPVYPESRRRENWRTWTAESNREKTAPQSSTAESPKNDTPQQPS